MNVNVRQLYYLTAIISNLTAINRKLFLSDVNDLWQVVWTRSCHRSLIAGHLRSKKLLF